MNLSAKIRVTRSRNDRNVELPHYKNNIRSLIRRRIQNIGLWYDTFTGIHWRAYVHIIIYLTLNITQFIGLFMDKENTMTLFACLSTLSFFFTGVLKLYSLIVKQKQWVFLINQAATLENYQLEDHNNTDEYESDDENDSSFFEHIRSYTKRFTWISTNLQRVYYFTVTVYLLLPFIEYGFGLYRRNNPISPHTLSGWSPLEFCMIGYVLTVLSESLACIYCVRVHMAFDLTVVGLMIFVHGQFDILHNYSERIGGKGKNYHLNYKRDNRAHFRIQECHKIHVLLLESVEGVSNLIQYILGIYFFQTTLTLCTVALQFNSEKLSTTELLRLLQYLGGNLVQLYLYCHYGDAVFSQSPVGLGEGPFSAASWCLGPKIRREIAILCAGMSKPCKIHVGPFNSLDLPAFIQVLRAAYGYYAVIRQSSS